jgi:hypothetical protein
MRVSRIRRAPSRMRRELSSPGPRQIRTLRPGALDRCPEETWARKLLASPNLPSRRRGSRPRGRSPPGRKEPSPAHPAPRSTDEGSVLALASVLSLKPVTVLVHGTSRDLVNLVTYGLVAWTGSEYSWIDVRLGRPSRAAVNPVQLGVIALERLVVVERLDEMAPHEIGTDVVRSMIRSDGPKDTMAEISEFVHLPRPVQLAIARTVPGPKPGIMVVSNAHRLIALYPAASVPQALREVTALGASIFVSFGDVPPVPRTAFDFVLRVEGDSAERWETAKIALERVVGRGSYMEGRHARVVDIAPLAYLLRAALGPATRSP